MGLTDNTRERESALSADPEILVRAENLTKYYSVQASALMRTKLRAIDSVTVAIRRGETLALVGESGSGKSTLGRLLIRLLKPSEGRIWFDGGEIDTLRGQKLREFRRRAGIIFQNPYRSLNPRMTVGAALAEPLRVWRIVPHHEVAKEVDSLLRSVDLPVSYADRYPHAMSGGQRQRVAIARALAVRPEFLVADEAVSSLDVSTAAGILNLMIDLQSRLGLTTLFVTHDLGIARHIGDRIAVMRHGQIIEVATPSTLVNSPQQEYTKLLLSSSLSLPDEMPVAAERLSSLAATDFTPKFVPDEKSVICERPGPGNGADGHSHTGAADA